MRVFSGRLRLTWYLAEFAWNLFRQCRSEQSKCRARDPISRLLAKPATDWHVAKSRDEENHFIVAQHIKVEALCEAAW